MRAVRLAGLSALALVTLIAGCAAPRYTYAADSSAHAYFKVPHGWARITGSALAAATSSGKSSAWTVAYDASAKPSAEHVLGSVAAEPFAYATVGRLSPAATNVLSYNGLRDFILPVTASARQEAAKENFPLTSFHLLGSSTLSLAQGVHGVRVIFDYTYPGGRVVTFDQIALTNADNTEIYLLMVHCLATCYSAHHSQINTVMTSFTVRRP